MGVLGQHSTGLRDTVPGVRPAGLAEVFAGDTVAKDVQADVFYPQPDTPNDLKRFRRPPSPGRISVHWAQVDDKIAAPDFSYGIRTHKGENVATTLDAGRVEGIAEYIHQRGESIYESTKREPLGRGYSRGHVLPQQTQSAEFRFGIKQTQGEQGKEIIFPRGNVPEPETVRKQYVMTHGSYDPGEAVDRKYEWPIDPRAHRFGTGADSHGNRNGEGVKDAVTMDRDYGGGFPATRIVKREAEDFRRVNNDELGKSRNLMQGMPPVPPGFSFGVGTNESGITAGECIRGWYPEPEQLPDPDLGTCLKVGRRNQTVETRAFGCPSIRNDIPRPRVRSVADCQNYGNEVGASALLNPQRFELVGIPDSDFLLRRPRDELRDILSCAGYTFDDDLFGTLWQQAVALFNDSEELASLDALLFVYSEHINQEVAQKCGSLTQSLKQSQLPQTRPIPAQ